MNKEEFLAMSLPYKLKMASKLNLKEIFDVYGIEINEGLFHASQDEYGWYCMSLFKPILHQLSDLTKEIEHNGEKFVPNTKLENEFDIEDFDIHLEYLVSREDDGNVYISIEKQLNIGLKLIEWHFDIAGLIEKGEAIDINTLQTNPYK